MLRDKTDFDQNQLTGLLGVPLFTSDHYMPAYIEGSIGKWRLSRTGFCLDRGYCSGLWMVQGMPVLMRDCGSNGAEWETWMSLSPHEIESQELGCRHASGHTVVMGLGMGWVAINMALNPKVIMVTIIERDPEVIELFGLSGARDGLPEEINSKIRIIRADALEWQPDLPVNFLYADIWRCLEEPQTLDEVRRMQANVQADRIYYWGQELTIHAMSMETDYSSLAWEVAVHKTVSENIALPLLMPDEFDYPQMIAMVARLRRERFPEKYSDI